MVWKKFFFPPLLPLNSVPTGVERANVGQNMEISFLLASVWGLRATQVKWGERSVASGTRTVNMWNQRLSEWTGKRRKAAFHEQVIKMLTSFAYFVNDANWYTHLGRSGGKPSEKKCRLFRAEKVRQTRHSTRTDSGNAKLFNCSAFQTCPWNCLKSRIFIYLTENCIVYFGIGKHSTRFCRFGLEFRNRVSKFEKNQHSIPFEGSGHCIGCNSKHFDWIYWVFHDHGTIFFLCLAGNEFCPIAYMVYPIWWFILY